MALKNKPLYDSEKDRTQILSDSKEKQINKKFERIEDIYFGEIALSRINEKSVSSKEARKQLGL